MILIIISIIFLIWLIVGVLNDNDTLQVIFGIMFGIIGIITIIALPIGYITNNASYENIEKYKNYRVIYEKQANEILPQLKEVLIDYGKYEKDIYSKITLNNYTVYLAKYPELKNIEAVKLLTTEIKAYTNKMYETDILIEDMKADIRKNKNNPFIIIKQYKID
jgi:hypothetical protein